MGFRHFARRAAVNVRPHVPDYVAESLEPRRLLAGEVYSAWAEPASVPEGQPAAFFVKVDLPAAAPNSYTLIVPYSFPVPVPGPGIANPSPPPANLQADHSGQASGGTVGVTIYAGAQSGQGLVNVSTFVDGVTEGAEVAKFVVKDGAAEANLTITDTTYGTPPPGGGGGGGGSTPVNRPPVVNDASMRVDEYAGLTATMTGTYSDPDGDAVNCNATGLLQGETFTAENGVWKWTFSRSDGPMTRSINITAYSTGGSDTATASATVLNVAPYVHGLVVLPTVIDEGGTVTLTGQITDPGADTFTLYFDWNGDGAWDETLPAGSARTFTRSHAYPDDDPTGTPFDVKSVRAGVRDDDQAEGPPSSSTGGESASVTVNNVAPTVLTAAPTTPIVEVGRRAIVEAGPAGVGTPFTAEGTFADPGQPDTFQDSTVDYGDNTGPQSLTLGGQGTFTVAAHHYLEPGNYTADVTIKDDDTGTSASTEISRIPVTAVRLGDLTVTDAAHAGNLVRSAGLEPPHLFVGQRADGTAAVKLAQAVAPAGSGSEVTRHVLWRVTGADVMGAAAGNFAQPPTVTLAPANDGARTFTVESGFDDDGNGVLAAGEVSRRAEVHVILADLDADSDNNNGPYAPSRNATEDGMEALPPGKYVLLNDDDDNNNELPDLGEAPVGGEDDLVPLVIGFEHLGTYRTGLKYKLSLAGSGLDKVRVWADPSKGASVELGTPVPVPESPSRMVWVEGRVLSQVEGDVQLEVEILAPTYSSGMLALTADDVRETVIKVDLDVDSDRSNGIAAPDRNLNEELLESKNGQMGKLVATNDDDRDGDLIPDFADGFDAFDDTDSDGLPIRGNDATPPTAAQGGGFVPVVVEVPNVLDLTRATFQFNYAASDPALVTRTGGTNGTPVTYAPAPGKLRLWTKDGVLARGKRDIAAGGDYVNSLSGANTYTPADWSKLGITAANRTTTLWLEGIDLSVQRGDLKIVFGVDPDGDLNGTNLIVQDLVTVTSVDVDVLVGATTATDDALTDDWVGAVDMVPPRREHKIYNWLRLRGPASVGQTLQLSSAGVPGGGTVAIEGFDLASGAPLGRAPTLTRTLDTETGTVDSVDFLLIGGARSAALDDVALHAMSPQGQMFGSQTASVIEFGYEEEVGSEPIIPQAGMVDGNYIINPAVRRNTRQVFAFDVGNVAMPATDARRHDASMLGGTTPALDYRSTPASAPRKFGPDTIEVTWARQIEGATASSVFEKLSTDGSTPGSQLSFAPTGVNGAIVASNLRVMDSSITGSAVDGNEFHYYVGHPTESVPQIGGLQGMYAKKAVVVTKADLVYNLTVNVISSTGTLAGAGLTPADVTRLVMEASSVWEQVGVKFNHVGTTVLTPATPAEFNLPNDDWPTVTAVTKKSRANGLDVFVVNTINSPVQFLAGKAAYENHPSVGVRETGVLLARAKAGPTSAFEDISVMARTMAHEIGHLLFNSVFDDHDNRAWNLMRDGKLGSTNNADLNLTENTVGHTGSRDNITIQPSGAGGYNSDESW